MLDRDLASPPTDPSDGDAYLVAPSATGDWAGHEGRIAVWNGGWHYHEPREGWLAWVADEDILLIHDGSAWQPFTSGAQTFLELTDTPADFAGQAGRMVRVNAAEDALEFADAPQGGITSLNPADGGKVGVNTTADDTNRLAVKSDAVLFSHDDATGSGSGDMRAKLNKAGEGNTASFLFQDNWSGRAEFGLTGDDDFHLKVSADGSAWRESMIANRQTGAVSFPHGHDIERHLPASVTGVGGADWWGPADHMTTCYGYGNTIGIVQDRMYFCSFYVPRPLLLLGGFVSLYQASTTSGALLRAGVYELGAPNGGNWDIGNLVADFGAQPADAAGNKIFDLSSPVSVPPGWYVCALGVSGADARAYYGRWLTPGTQRVYPSASGTNARPRLAGHSVYLHESNSAQEINNGLPAVWSRNPVSDAISTNGWIYQLMFPKWRIPS